MSKSKLPLYSKSMDWDSFYEDVPPPDIWYENNFRWSGDQIRAYQEKHFLKVVAAGWKIPFYQRLWGGAGLEPGDIRSFDDLEKLPTFGSEDLKNSIEASPPFVDFPGIIPGEFLESSPLKVQTSGGTTGLPRPTLYGPRGVGVQRCVSGAYDLCADRSSGRRHADSHYPVARKHGLGLLQGMS